MTTRKKRKRKVAKGRVAVAVLLALIGILLILLGTWALLHPNGTEFGFGLFTTASQTSQTEPGPSSETPSAQPQPVYATNPLTGTQTLAEDMVNTRPVAFMINNARAAFPHNGIANFDVVYELPVEGASTRLMALTADYRQALRYGSLRSARHDFVELAAAADAVLVHWGGSDFAYNAISRYGVDHLDGMRYGEQYFITDRSLGRDLEHTRFIDPDGLGQGLDAVSADLAQEGYPSLFSFNQSGNTTGDIVANQVTVPATGEITATFTYDAAKGQYAKGEFGTTETDGNTGETVYVDNAFILYTSVSVMEDGVHKDIGLSSGSGYYISKGTAQSISWSKGNAGSRLTFTDPSGAELQVNPGKSWIIFTGSSPSNTQFS